MTDLNERMTDSHAPKIFCIGMNKTGTTSIEKVLVDLGFSIGVQLSGELLINDWAKRDFRAIIEFAKTANAFRDVPFSLPYTFQALDQYFTNAKFILTVRNNAEEWYWSKVKFHSKRWADGNRIPTIEDLKNAPGVHKDFVINAFRLIHKTPDTDPYNKEILTEIYRQHNASVRDYFHFKPEKLIEINVSHPSDYTRLCAFLGKKPLTDGFPWLNKT